jgi:hypothetical protein
MNVVLEPAMLIIAMIGAADISSKAYKRKIEKAERQYYKLRRDGKDMQQAFWEVFMKATTFMESSGKKPKQVEKERTEICRKAMNVAFPDLFACANTDLIIPKK